MITALEIKYAFHIGIDFHLRKRFRRSAQLQLRLLDVVVIEMHIAKSMDELACLQSANTGNHHRK